MAWVSKEAADAALGLPTDAVDGVPGIIKYGAELCSGWSYGEAWMYWSSSGNCS